MVLPSDHDQSRNQTTRARGQLYVLLTQFRKEAVQSNDAEVSGMFLTAAEVIAGLARSFREYERHTQPDNSEDASGSDCSS